MRPKYQHVPTAVSKIDDEKHENRGNEEKGGGKDKGMFRSRLF